MRRKRPRVVFDTNILVSATVFRGIPRELVKLLAQKRIKVFISPFIIEELSRVLSEKFHFNEERLEKLQERLEKSTKTVIPTKSINVIKVDEADNRILEAAVAANADYIVSGDKDLLRLKTFKDIRIVTAREFLQETGYSNDPGSE